MTSCSSIARSHEARRIAKAVPQVEAAPRLAESMKGRVDR
jgi:hypothetical protein